MIRVASPGIFNYSYRVPSNELFEGFLRPEGCTLQGIQPLSKTVLSTITSLGLGLGLDACFDQGRDSLGVRSRGIFEHIDPPTKEGQVKKGTLEGASLILPRMVATKRRRQQRPRDAQGAQRVHHAAREASAEPCSVKVM